MAKPLNRCCRDSIHWARLNSPTEGLEIPCRWCSGYLRFTNGAWVYHDSPYKELR